MKRLGYEQFPLMLTNPATGDSEVYASQDEVPPELMDIVDMYAEGSPDPEELESAWTAYNSSDDEEEEPAEEEPETESEEVPETPPTPTKRNTGNGAAWKRK